MPRESTSRGVTSESQAIAACTSSASLDILSDELWERVARHMRPADLLAFGRTCSRGRRAYRAVVERRKKLFASRVSGGVGSACRPDEPVTDLKLALSLPDTAEWMGYYAQATLSPRDGRFVVRVFVRCCHQCNPLLDFTLGSVIDAGAELWDTRTATRKDVLHFNVKYPGEKHIELRWTRHDRLCVIIGESSHENDAPQVYTLYITRSDTLKLVRSLVVDVEVPKVDIFDDGEQLEESTFVRLPQVIRVRTTAFDAAADQSQFEVQTTKTKAVITDGRLQLSDPLMIQTSMDGKVMLVYEPASLRAHTFALDTLPDAENHHVAGNQSEVTNPLASFDTHYRSSNCFLSPCGSYVAVVTTVFKSEDLLLGYTEEVSIRIHRSNCDIPLHSHCFSFPAVGDFRPSESHLAVRSRGAYADCFFGDCSESKCDVFVLPMNNDDFPIIISAETGEVLWVPDSSDRCCNTPACLEDNDLYRFSLNESLFLTLYSADGDDGLSIVRVFDCISRFKLVCTFRTPCLHRWRCEAHPSGLVLLENNCTCCVSCVLAPAAFLLGDSSSDSESFTN